jgi:hypothetical protein
VELRAVHDIMVRNLSLPTNTGGRFIRGFTMSIIASLRDFAVGVSRGVGLFLTERNDYTATVMTPGLSSRKRRN